VKVSARGVDTQNIRGRMDALSRDVNQAIAKAIRNGLETIATDVRQSMSRGKHTGRIYRKYNPRRDHQASAPGETPAVDTGVYVGQITTVMDKDGRGGQVESRGRQAAILEFGAGRVAARPHMDPALKRNQKRIMDRVAADIDAAIKKHGIDQS